MKKLLLLLPLLISCVSSPKLTDDEAKVNVITGSYSLAGCKLRGEIREPIPISYSSDMANNHLAEDYLKRAALKLGANTVITIGRAGMGEMAYGTAYTCDK